MKATLKLMSGLAVLQQYGDDPIVNAEHDIIMVNVREKDVTDDERSLLTLLGWHFNSEFDSWAFFT